MKALKLFTLFVLFSLVISACQTAGTAETPAAEAAAPAECAADAFGCAVFKPGEVVKIGMGAPMTGGDASYGIDISSGGFIAIDDFGDLNGFKFELVAEDDGGTPEGGA
ncbi:MAG TPA: hypothetical protein P5282_03435, partial [Anaerolineaceae bacterium]|nr:hypothetical protein [Anaerolineaceae bacterium]